MIIKDPKSDQDVRSQNTRDAQAKIAKEQNLQQPSDFNGVLDERDLIMMLLFHGYFGLGQIYCGGGDIMICLLKYDEVRTVFAEYPLGWLEPRIAPCTVVSSNHCTTLVP